MKKIILLSGFLFLLSNINISAQGNEIDAFTLSNTELSGTARSIAMGGAFGALGGDISALSNNPAGLGIYRSSEIAGTLNLSTINTSTNWSGTTSDQNKTRFNMNNLGLVFYFPTNSGSVNSWSLGLSYNRLKNFNRRYKMSSGNQGYSLSDYAASRASNAFGEGSGITKSELTLDGNYDPYYNSELAGQWLSILGYEGGFFDNHSGRNDVFFSDFGTSSLSNSQLYVNESGYIDEYNIGFGMNISDFMFIGASTSVTDIKYNYTSTYDETFKTSRNDYLYLDNWLTTEGTAFSFNIGVITNLQMLRLGVAYNSPRWYDLTDYYSAEAGSAVDGDEMWNGTPEDQYSEYRFRTPGKWIFSGALILGQSALISADYELTNYKGMKFSDRDGWDDYMTNDFIKDDFTFAHTLKLGAEIKPTQQFAIRAGYMMQTSPMRTDLSENNIEVLPSGTIPHFNVVSKPTHYLTAGLGYRFTPRFYMDLACVYRFNNSDAYAFSNMYHEVANKEIYPVYSEPASLKTRTINVALTMGLKF
jgi:hypothetical protein